MGSVSCSHDNSNYHDLPSTLFRHSLLQVRGEKLVFLLSLILRGKTLTRVLSNNRKQREEYAAALEAEVRIDDARGHGRKNADVGDLKFEDNYSDDTKGGPNAAELEMALAK